MVTRVGECVRDRRSYTENAGLTAAQTPIWLDALFFPDKPIANTGIVVALTGPLDRPLFLEALRRVVAETDTLRIRLSMEREQVRQEIVPVSEIHVEQRDFSASADAEREARAWIDEQFWTPLNWNDFPLFRFFLAKIGPARHLWVQKFNHLVIDAIGRHLLAKRTIEIYDALKSGVPEPAKPGASLDEMLAAEDGYRRSEQYGKDRDYWLKQFATLPDPLVQKDRRETERMKSGRAQRSSFDISDAAFRRLDGLAKSLGSTLPRMFLGFVQLVFSRLYGKSDLVLWFALHNRMTPRFKETIGMFSQNIPLRLDIDLKASLADALKQVDSALSAGREHSRFPPSELASLLQMARHESGLYDVLVNYVPAPTPIAFNGKTVEIANLSSGFLNAWGIMLIELGAGRGAKLIVDYDPGLIETGEAARLARCLHVLLSREIASPARSIGELQILDESERKKLLEMFNRTVAPLPAGATLASLCDEQARRTPQATALVSGTERLDFAALHERAGALARTLVGLGVGPDTIVGVALPRDADLIAAVLGVHKAGGAYLPLDPGYPAERIAYIVKDARAPVIITTRALAAKLPETSAHILLLDAVDDSRVSNTDAELPRARPENLAYVLYTSGSTGQPKGVGVEHRNVVNLLFAMRDFIGTEDLDGVLFATSFNFDISVYEIFMPLVFGGRMIIVENLLDVCAAPARNDVRLINTGPSLLEALLRIGSLPPNICTINLAGEALPRSLADRIFAAAPNVRLMNAYGPTETTIYSTAGWVPKGETALSPAIGRPVRNTQCYVVDGAGSLLPVGATGELYITGAGVSRGYLSRPELDEERFPKNPFGDGRMYRTGDLVKWREDGELEFAGRADHQIKIHGQRVELGEIEEQLKRVAGIASAVVIARTDKYGNAVHAYVIAQDEQKRHSLEQINTELAKFLPRHMLLSTVTWLKKFPMTPNGKLDRRALPEPDAKGVRAVRRNASGEYELVLERIWKDVLQLHDIGVEDDFYELGGTSLQAFMIFSQVKSALGFDIPPSIMMQAPTIATEAEFLASHLKPETTERLVTFRETGIGEPLFFLHAAGGGCMFVRELLRHLKSPRPVYGIQAPPLDGRAKLPRKMKDVASVYIAEIRKRQPKGPYHLAGYSFGGWVAYEMAQQLTAQGERVAFLGMIDASIPNAKIVSEVRYHLQQLQHRSPLAYLAPKIRKTVKYHYNSVMRRLSEIPNDLRHSLYRPIPYVQRTAFYRHVFDGAVRRYSPQPYDGRVVVFGRTGLLGVHYARWQTLAKQGVVMREIPSGHRELVWPPFSTLLAQHLDSFLEPSTAAPRIHEMS